MNMTRTEENYLKAILKLTGAADQAVSTNAIAAQLETSAASVTDMLKKLGDKGLVDYQRYKGSALSDAGHRMATTLVRRHRLWEVFLVNTLGMSWDEVHDIAEELEHIQSDALISRLDAFLGYPKFDPHGDPIPNAQGKYTLRSQIPLSELGKGKSGVVLGVREDDDTFLKYLREKGLVPGKQILVLAHDPYDNMLRISVDGHEASLSATVSKNILIKPSLS
jgi:DtxR family Mn-dependent transcriptional regulator